MKLKPAYETEVFISYDGYLAVGQTYDDGDKPLIVLTAEQAECVAREIRRLLEDKAAWWRIDDDAPELVPVAAAKPPAVAKESP